MNGQPFQYAEAEFATARSKLLTTFTASLLWLLGPLTTFASDGIIHNDTVWRDTEGKEIWSNGGHILREGDMFYWVGYDTGPGRWPWRINLYSSRNLADWKFENSVIRMEGDFSKMGGAGQDRTPASVDYATLRGLRGTQTSRRAKRGPGY